MTSSGHPWRAPAMRANLPANACASRLIAESRAPVCALIAFVLTLVLSGVSSAGDAFPLVTPLPAVESPIPPFAAAAPAVTVSAIEEVAGGISEPPPITISGQPIEQWDDMGVRSESLDGRDDVWVAQILPDGIMYQSYMAGAKESRMASRWHEESDLGTIWDISLGGRAAIWRNGTTDGYRPEGWELEIEGAALLRLDPDTESDLVGTDYRFGVPLIYGCGNYQQKFAYYHLSSHAGDEFLLKNPGFPRINYVRDELVWGHSYYLTRWLRVYGEAGWAFNADIAEPWEFQFGLDYIPPGPTGPTGDWFWAVNAHLREEVNFGGNAVAQIGRAWRGGAGGHIFRAGIEYYNGKSDQFEFYNESEQKIGLCLWYDH